MKKFLILVLSLIFAVSALFAGCTVTTVGTEGGSSSGGSSSGGTTTEDSMTEDSYTVTLSLPSGVTAMPDLTGIQAKWTNSTSVYAADFSSDGVAYYNGLDGEYTVTISGTIEGYTYNPNIYSADGTTEGRNVVIELTALQSFQGGDGSAHDDGTRAIAYDLGFYRIEFTSASQSFYFEFLPTITTTGYVFSVESYADTTANEINPSFSYMWYSNRKISSTVNDGSDYYGSYTKNFRTEVEMSTYTSGGHNSYIYVISITSTDGNYPKYLDICIAREREYSSDEYWDDMGGLYTVLTEDDVQDYNADYEQPTGTLRWVSDLYTDFSDCTVQLMDDGFWYINYGGDWHMLFVELSTCHYSAEGGSVSYGFSSSARCGNSMINYINVINVYLTTATSSGMHPVTQQLEEFLYDYSASWQIFFDGNGFLETSPYYITSNDANQWLFACGFYM